MNKILKWTLSIFGTGLLFYCGFWLYRVALIIGAFEQTYSTNDLIENYQIKKAEIQELRKYIKKVVPANRSVDIEFDGDNQLRIFHVGDTLSYDRNWSLKLGTNKTDDLLKKLGWTKEVLQVLKEKLDDAGCISVQSGEPCQIGFQRRGMGKFYYNIFDAPVGDSLKSKYNDSCTYIFYNEKVILEYGGGAIGAQCFPEVRR